jgi:hypothetical protein
MSKIIIIGEAPTPGNRQAGQALHPHLCASGRRLLDYSGWTLAEYLGRTDRRNLYPHPVDKSTPWNAAFARIAAQVDARSIPLGGTVILLGHRVAEAFGYVHASVLTGFLPLDGGLFGRHVAVVPHPSGRSRYWNNPANRDAARAFLRAVMDRRP